MAPEYFAPPAPEGRIEEERERRLNLKLELDELMRSCNGYRARKIRNFSARHHRSYTVQSCDRLIPFAKRSVGICIKCGNHSWETRHEKYGSVISHKYQPELLVRESTIEDPITPVEYCGPEWKGLVQQSGLC